ncbi:hypothetical protein [Pantanalinema sp. GBBB05]|uniref:hypothetical protein n=1 Tax=Pantanalinema sp. GBBB05 TaxID=2604139 RepID=UPI001DAC901B|nr:hypothetical protein [Pantanalinema sp. GBBB05]
MQGIKSMTNLLVSALSTPHSLRSSSPRQQSQSQTHPQKQTQGYIDGYTYRRVASSAEAVTAINEFYLNFLGREADGHDVRSYLYQWNRGRSLRSIRDEIANCHEAQKGRWA